MIVALPGLFSYLFFTIQKWGLRGSKLYRFVFLMDLSKTEEFQKKEGLEVIKLFFMLNSTQLSMKLVLLINLKLLTTANSFLLNIAEHENVCAK